MKKAGKHKSKINNNTKAAQSKGNQESQLSVGFSSVFHEQTGAYFFT